MSLKFEGIGKLWSTFDLCNKAKNSYYWRLVGESNQNLLSLEIKDGLVYSIELLGFDNSQIVKYPIPYTHIGNIEKYTPHVYLLPDHEKYKVTINGIYIDNYINFSVSSYNNAFKIFWSEKVHTTVFICDYLSLELSDNNELIGIIINKNLEDTFKKSDLDLTLYSEL